MSLVTESQAVVEKLVDWKEPKAGKQRRAREENPHKWAPRWKTKQVVELVEVAKWSRLRQRRWVRDFETNRAARQPCQLKASH